MFCIVGIAKIRNSVAFNYKAFHNLLSKTSWGFVGEHCYYIYSTIIIST